MARTPRKPSRTAGPAFTLLIVLVGALLIPTHADAATPPRARFWAANETIVVHVENLPQRRINCQLWIPDPVPWGFDANRIVRERVVTTGSVTLSAVPQLHPLPFRYYTFVHCFAFSNGTMTFDFVRKATLFVTPFGGFGS